MELDIWGWTKAVIAQNPSNVYATVAAPTSYTAQLIVTTNFGSSTSSQVITVSEAKPTALFSATSTAGRGPLPIQFNDGSTYPTASAFTTWAWDFGDGNNSSVQNPNHIYGTVAAPTSYNVQLVVTTPFGVSTSTQTNYITVSEPKPTASFSANSHQWEFAEKLAIEFGFTHSNIIGLS